MAVVTDKRNHPRKKINIPIKYYISGKEYITNALDLSQDGLMIESNSLIGPDKEIHIDLPILEKEPSIRIKGIIVWEQNKIDNLKIWNVGIKFVSLDSASRIKIIEYLKEVDLSNIIILTLDSLYANIIVRKLIKNSHKKIKLICLSQRFSRKRGSLIRQTINTIKQSGFSLVNYLSFYFLYHNFFIYIIRLYNKLSLKKSEIYTLRELTRKYSIPIYMTDDINSNKSIEFLKNLKPDLVISSNFDQKLKKEIINMPRFGCINLHWALLPNFRGPFPSFWGLFEGKEKLGVTIHYIDEKFDEGDIIQQEEIRVNSGDSILSIDCRLLDLGVDLIIKVIEKIETGTISRVNQKMLGVGSYYSFPTSQQLKTLKKRGIKLFSLGHYFKQLNY